MSEESPPFSLLSLWPFRSGRGHVTARPPNEEEVGQESAETGSDFLATELLFRAVFLPITKTREDKNPTSFFSFKCGWENRPGTLSFAAMVFIFH